MSYGTFKLDVKTPGHGFIDALETAWNDNLSTAAVLLNPAPRRFVFARAHVQTSRPGTLTVTVHPFQQGQRLVAHARYPPVLRLWVNYTPIGATHSTIGSLGLHLSSSCANHNTVAAVQGRTVVRCTSRPTPTSPPAARRHASCISGPPWNRPPTAINHAPLSPLDPAAAGETPDGLPLSW